MTDLISRQAAIDAVCAVCGNDCDKSKFIYDAPQTEQVIMCPEHYALSTLPLAQPERKNGRWEMKPDPFGFFGEIPVCSECGCTTKMRDKTKFCPHCGAQMEGQ